MEKAEFEAEIKDGMIYLPGKYVNAKKAKVIILDAELKNNEDFIYRAVNNPAHISGSPAFLTREKANER